MTKDQVDKSIPKTVRRLIPAMLAKADKIYPLLDPADVDIDFIKTYEELIPKSGALDIGNLVEIGSRFLYAADQCKDASVVAAAMATVGKTLVEREYAIAGLVRFPNYCQERDIQKPTEKVREAYQDMDAIYCGTVDCYNKWKSLADYFEKTRLSFENWHNWAKKLYDIDGKGINSSQHQRD